MLQSIRKQGSEGNGVPVLVPSRWVTLEMTRRQSGPQSSPLQKEEFKLNDLLPTLKSCNTFSLLDSVFNTIIEPLKDY